MAAFERISSGIPEMDKAFDNIRLGDNVVWQVPSLKEFHFFLEPYVEQAIKDGIKIISIDELPKNFDRRYLGWIDTPENRQRIKEYCEKRKQR